MAVEEIIREKERMNIREIEGLSTEPVSWNNMLNTDSNDMILMVSTVVMLEVEAEVMIMVVGEVAKWK